MLPRTVGRAAVVRLGLGLAGALATGCDDGAGAAADTGTPTTTTTPTASDATTSGDADAPTAVAEDATKVDDSPVADVVLGDPDVLVGGFQVSLIAPDLATDTPGLTSILGTVYDGPTPIAVGSVETAASGDCRLIEPVVPFCAEPCAGGALCVADDACQGYPAVVNVGRVTVTGIRTASGATAFAIDPLDPEVAIYQPTGPSLPYPAFAAGDVITVSAAGGAYAPFAVSAFGVAPLAVTSGELVLEADRALDLAWTPATALGGALHVKLDISHHGGTKGAVECDTADDGALTIDGGLVTALLGLGYSGLPTIKLTRQSMGSVTMALGRVDLTIASEVELGVTIPGLVSCTSTEECPDGTTCQDDLACR